METVEKILINAKCDKYVDVFAENGYDSAAHLLLMGPADFDSMARACNILPGHLHRLQTYIRGIKARAHDARVVEEFSNKEVATTEEAVVASASVKSADDSELSSKLPDVNNNKIVLEEEYETWDQAKLASLRFNTAAGCSAMQDTKQSGGRKHVFRCRSVLSKRKLKEMEGPSNCPHKLVWNNKRSKGSNWVLNKAQSHLQHMPFCGSGQKVTRCELTHDPAFIKSCTIDKKCTGASAARHAIGGKYGRLAGAVDTQTARRARNDIKHTTDRDYEDDWNKLPQWKREFEEKNPNSRCVIKTKLKDGLKMFVLMWALRIVDPFVCCIVGPLFYCYCMSLVLHAVLSALKCIVKVSHIGPRALGPCMGP